ncbi:glycogen/starch synthase [Candidatus Woesearchaeota archaeon]|nr:glycogen/starch synthase [Candidatus Woesearchaeota archaeon]
MPGDERPVPRADLVVEFSWEACNKVGGIYTVIMSKAAHMRQYYDDYVVVGPYFKDRADYEMEEQDPPEEYERVFEELRKEGIFCYYGTWLIKGEPKVVLIDYRGLNHRKDEFKHWLWERYGIDSLRSGWDFEEPVIWSWACGRFLELLAEGPYEGRKVLSHHHEWLSGFSLLYAKDRKLPVRTVFTTHATMLGRSLAGRGFDLYAEMGRFDPRQKAYEVGVQDKFLTEVACAKHADVFTTVSEVMAIEAEQLLGRKPEVLVLNGFDSDRFPTIEETSIKHVTSRERLREFQTFYFFPYYHNFKLEDNLMMCISGRYEFGNKGMDVFVDSLARLNDKLREERTGRTVTVFFWLLRDNDGVHPEVLENKNYYQHIRNYVQWHSAEILKDITRDFITSDDPVKESFFTKEFMHEMKKDVLHFKREGNPPLCSHRMPYPDTDPLIRKLLERGLDNRSDDKVKVIVSPVFLDGNDGLLNLSYYEALAGTHFAIFPSSYEPWGYTPLEAAALGVPTLTTDLAGFGRYVQHRLLEDQPGVYLLERFKKSYEEIVSSLYDLLYRFVSLDHAERVQNKINAKQLSKLADWKHMVKHYIEAHNLALSKEPKSG